MGPLPNRVAFTLIAIALTTFTAAAQSRVPDLDLRAVCRALDSNDFSMQIDTQRCLKTEHEARAKLADEWSQFKAKDRDLCTQMAKMGGMHSYVQLLTCLELERDVVADRARAQSRNATRDNDDNAALAEPAGGIAGSVVQARSSRASLTCAFHCDMLSAMIFTEVIATWLSCA